MITKLPIYLHAQEDPEHTRRCSALDRLVGKAGTLAARKRLRIPESRCVTGKSKE